MSHIQISVAGTDLEIIAINLDEIQVAALYTNGKVKDLKITELEKKITSMESTAKYVYESRAELAAELKQSHALMTALGVAEKTTEEQDYNRSFLTMSTRVALYIASTK
jgi:predicted RNA-binding protein with EMAP domain